MPTTNKIPAGSSTEKKNSINATALCKIIEACNKNGVKEFRSGDLYLSFVTEAPALPSEFPVEQPMETHRNLELLQPPKLEPSEDEDDLSELMISDPLAYEERLMRASDGK